MKEVFLTFHRACQITAAFNSLLINFFMHRNKEEKLQRRAAHLRKTIEGLGSVFMKFAQVFALRPDLIPKEYCHEMMYLLDKAPKIPFADIEKAFKKEAGKTLKQVFKSFDEDPLATASMGQVHKAVLKNGKKVAVKILRPGLEESIHRDLRILKTVAWFYDLLTLWSVHLKKMAEEVEYWTKQEMDFRNEARSTEIFLKSIKGDSKSIEAPKIYPEYSGQRVLVMEFIDGFCLSQFLRARRRHDNKFIKKIKKEGFSPHEVTMQLFLESAKYMYLDGVYHADLHPANIMFEEKTGRLCFIDFGIIGVLSEEQRLQCLRYLRSVIYHDKNGSFSSLEKLFDMSNVRNRYQVKKDHDRIFDEVFGTEIPINDPEKAPQIIGIWIAKTIALLHCHHIKIPISMLKYFRSLAMFESTIFEVDPEMEISKLGRKLRNISIVNVLNNMSNLVENGSLDALMIKGLDALEERM